MAVKIRPAHRRVRLAVLVCATFLAAVSAASAQELGMEMGTKPFFAPSGGVGAVAERPLTEESRAAAVFEFWVVGAKGGVDSSGEPTRTYELAAGLRLELAVPRFYTGLGVGIHGVVGRWQDGHADESSLLESGMVSLELFHPLTVLHNPCKVILLPALSAYFSFGPTGFSSTPDLLPTARVRAIW